MIPGTTTVAAAPVNACTALNSQKVCTSVVNANASELKPNKLRPIRASLRLPI